MSENVTYGIGGMLDDHPNGNIVERVVDNGDGTGTRTTYDAAGQVESTENLTGLPVAEETVDPLTALRSSIAERLTDPAVNSIAKVKAAIVAAFDA